MWRGTPDTKLHREWTNINTDTSLSLCNKTLQKYLLFSSVIVLDAKIYQNRQLF